MQKQSLCVRNCSDFLTCVDRPAPNEPSQRSADLSSIHLTTRVRLWIWLRRVRFFFVALAEIDDHARVRVFAEQIRVFGLEFSSLISSVRKVESYDPVENDGRDSGSRATALHLHDLGFFVLKMIVDGLDEAIGKLLHFILNIAQAVLG